MPFDINKLTTFPMLPGVYLMMDAQRIVLYVGKAINIRQRVKQYFDGQDTRPQIPFLLEKVSYIDTIVVTSEKEALLLENNLIKQHQPRYNALLKDDKTYVALKVNHKHMWPKVQLVRYKGRPESDGLYFGPYVSAHAARITLDLIHRLFPLRQCTDQEFLRRTRPCILYDMKQCIAPCVGKCTKDQYDEYVDRAIKFLRGQNKDILQELYDQIQKHADSLEFEKAQELLTTIRMIEKTIEGQGVDKPLGGDSDAIAIYRKGEEVVLALLEVRQGKLANAKHYSFSNIVEDDEELLSSFLIQNYQQQPEMPLEIVLSTTIPLEEEVSEILSANKKAKVRIYSPKRGEKKTLIEMAYLNAKAFFEKEKDAQDILEKTLLEMRELLHLNQYPSRIECLDNSNISGKEPVAAMVAFTEGKPDKKRYRKYKIRSVNTPDDYATMYEVMMRRYKRAEEEEDLPDLVVVDGGKGHLNVALRVMQELNIVSVDVISVAKEQGRHDKGITSDQIFLPNRKDPLILKKTSKVLHLLQQIRDEAHRFAITFHRDRRSKQSIRSELGAIPGIGPIKQKNLLKHFGSVKKLKEASEEELMQVKGISKANVKSILEHFNRTN